MGYIRAWRVQFTHSHMADMRLWVLSLLWTALAFSATARVYDRCELAKELRDKIKVQPQHLATWVCIAHRESNYNTSIVGTLASEGKDHGIFQISDLFWCEHGDIGGACGLDCASLLDDDISDDYKCAMRIYRAHEGLQEDGFKAWAVYAPHCSAGRHALEATYTNDCFDQKTRAAYAHVTKYYTQGQPILYVLYQPYLWWEPVLSSQIR